MTTKPSFDLQRNAFGKLVLTNATGEIFESVVPVRAFPIQTPNAGIAIVDTSGQEQAWIEQLNELPAPLQQLLQEELNTREFMPEIQDITHVSSFATPSTWQVITNRGNTSFVLRGDEDIRHLGQGTLLISDNHGVQFIIRDRFALPKHSKKILDRFL